MYALGDTSPLEVAGGYVMAAPNALWDWLTGNTASTMPASQIQAPPTPQAVPAPPALWASMESNTPYTPSVTQDPSTIAAINQANASALAAWQAQLAQSAYGQALNNQPSLGLPNLSSLGPYLLIGGIGLVVLLIATR
jgi:deoxyribodipyrimidine photolyase